jgi:hypothetical protein
MSIALHEVAAGLVPSNFTPASRKEIVTRAQVVRISMRPTATPAPPPPSPPVVRRLHAVARTSTRRTRSIPAVSESAARPELAGIARSKPVWDLAASGATTGNGVVQSGNGAGRSGNGAGTEGNGTGLASVSEPCGFVTFSDPHGSQFDAQTRGFWVDIRMSVHFADGSSQSLILDYPWYYPSEAANPWSNQNLKDPNFPTRFQPPPAGKLADEPPLVHYVLSHSTPEGLTLLRDCPSPAPLTQRRRGRRL